MAGKKGAACSKSNGKKGRENGGEMEGQNAIFSI